ncbi:hypothetical protein ACO0SA_002121 [Hanseniaspora valbyensis]
MFLSSSKTIANFLSAESKLLNFRGINISRTILATNISSKRLNGQIPWFIQKYQQEQPLDINTHDNKHKNQLKEIEHDKIEQHNEVEKINPTVESAIKQMNQGVIQYSDEIIIHTDPVEDIEDLDLNDTILKQTEILLKKLKVTLNYKDITIINSKIKTSKDFVILLNSMDSKQHNDRILVNLKQFVKKFKKEDVEISDIHMTGYRQDYLSKKQRQRKEKKLSLNNGQINTRFHKRHGSENANIASFKGKDRSWGMLSFILNKNDKRFLFEIHVMSPLQRSLLNFEELYEIEGHHDAEELQSLLEDVVENEALNNDIAEEEEESIFENIQRR